MNQFNESMDIQDYLKQSLRTVDGLAWIAVCIVSLLCLADVLLEINVFPLREISRPNKAVTLLLFSPLLVFLILVLLRQLPFKAGRIMSWIRAVFCVFSFLVINF
jgi:hypothetical protein